MQWLQTNNVCKQTKLFVFNVCKQDEVGKGSNLVGVKKGLNQNEAKKGSNQVGVNKGSNQNKVKKGSNQG